MTKRKKPHPAIAKLRRSRRTIAKTAYWLARCKNDGMLSHDSDRAIILRDMINELLDDHTFHATWLK